MFGSRLKITTAPPHREVPGDAAICAAVERSLARVGFTTSSCVPVASRAAHYAWVRTLSTPHPYAEPPTLLFDARGGELLVRGPRSPTWYSRLARELSDAVGGVALFMVADRLHGEYGIGAYVAGQPLEARAWSMAGCDLAQGAAQITEPLPEESALWRRWELWSEAAGCAAHPLERSGYSMLLRESEPAPVLADAPVALGWLTGSASELRRLEARAREQGVSCVLAESVDEEWLGPSALALRSRDPSALVVLLNELDVGGAICALSPTGQQVWTLRSEIGLTIADAAGFAGFAEQIGPIRAALQSSLLELVAAPGGNSVDR